MSDQFTVVAAVDPTEQCTFTVSRDTGYSTPSSPRMQQGVCGRPIAFVTTDPDGKTCGRSCKLHQSRLEAQTPDGWTVDNVSPHHQSEADAKDVSA